MHPGDLSLFVTSVIAFASEGGMTRTTEVPAGDGGEENTPSPWPGAESQEGTGDGAAGNVPLAF